MLLASSLTSKPHIDQRQLHKTVQQTSVVFRAAGLSIPVTVPIPSFASRQGGFETGSAVGDCTGAAPLCAIPTTYIHLSSTPLHKSLSSISNCSLANIAAMELLKRARGRGGFTLLRHAASLVGRPQAAALFITARHTSQTQLPPP
jgi:hypothetical protein